MILCFVVVSCAGGALQPEEPIWGKQQCAHCAMLVSEKPSAAQVITAEGKRRFFDDPGCLLAWEARTSPRLVSRWVRGPGGTGWVDPQVTRFSSGNPTPMDFGFLADPQGSFSFDDVRVAVQEKANRGAQ